MLIWAPVWETIVLFKTLSLMLGIFFISFKAMHISIGRKNDPHIDDDPNLKRLIVESNRLTNCAKLCDQIGRYLKVFWKKFSYLNRPKYLVIFGTILDVCHFLIKTYFSYFLSFNFKIWVTFNSNIWSHCGPQPFSALKWCHICHVLTVKAGSQYGVNLLQPAKASQCEKM